MELETQNLDFQLQADLPLSPRGASRALEAGLELKLLGRRHSHKSDGKLLRVYNGLAFKSGLRQRLRKTVVKLVVLTYHLDIVTQPRFPSISKPIYQKLSLVDIFEVREGKGTHNFQRYGKGVKDDLCFSLILSRDLRNACVSLDFVCQSAYQCKIVLIELKRAISRSRWLSNSRSALGMRLRNQREAFWEDQFRKFDADSNGVLSLSELSTLLTVLGFPSSFKDVFGDFKDEEDEVNLTPQQFSSFCRNVRTSNALRPLFNELCWTEEEGSSAKGLTVAALERFVRKQSNDDDAVTSEVKTILEHCADPASSRLDFVGFCDFVTSPSLNGVLRPFTDGVNDGAELNKYLISSSHNTYLLADQVSGSSGVVAYINAFKRGFRCVEVDVHNGAREPIITHKNALTEVLTFEDFARATKQHAFSNGLDSPLIVSIENHCTPAFEAKMAAILLKQWGKENILPYAGPSESLPALKGARRKFILKGKVNEKTHPEYAAMLFLRSCNVKKATSDLPANEIVSLDEDGVVRSHALSDEFVERHLVRVYPRGTRIYSSNLNPIEAWSAGFQIVALNCQTHCQRFRINQLLFQDTCGYVSLDALRAPRATLDGLSIQILMGSLLPRSKQKSKTPSLRVQVFLYDVLEASLGDDNADLKVKSDPDELKENEGFMRRRAASKVRSLFKYATSASEDRGKDDRRRLLAASRRATDGPLRSRVSTIAGLFDEPVCETEDVTDNSFNPRFVSKPVEVRHFTSSALLVFLVVDRACADKVRAFGGGLLSRFRLGTRALPLLDASGLPLDGSCLLLDVKTLSPPSTTDLASRISVT